MENLDLAFAALADPTRRQLLRRIGTRPQPVTDLCTGFCMSQPAISKHLKVLREAGLVEADKRGREHVYHLRRDGINELKTYMDSISSMWDEALDAFAAYLEEKS